MNRSLLTTAVALSAVILWQDAHAFDGRFHGGGRGGGFQPRAGAMHQRQAPPRQNVQNFNNAHPQARQNAQAVHSARPQARQNVQNFNNTHPQARQNVQNFNHTHPNRDVNISGNNVVVNRGPGWHGGPVYVDNGNDYDWGQAIVGGLVGGAVGGLVAGAITNSSQPTTTYVAPAPTYAAPPPGYTTTPTSSGSGSSASAASASSSASTAQSAASSAQSSATQAQQAATTAQAAARQAQEATQQQAQQQPQQAAATMAPGGRYTYGTRFATVPDGCSAQSVGPIGYQQCGSDWLQPFMQGGSVVWMAVPPPR